MSVNDYLAEHYLGGNKTEKSKKKKPKQAGSTLIVEEDFLGWEDDRGESKRGGFRRVGSGEYGERKSKKKEKRGKSKIPTDMGSSKLTEPQLVQQEENADSTEPPSSAASATPFSGGLISAEALEADMKRKEQEEEARARERLTNTSSSDLQQQTVYRDTTGRVVDIKAAAEEAEKAAKEAAVLKELQQKELLLGPAQKEEMRQRKLQQEAMKAVPLQVSIDDKELNKSLQETLREEDPALSFLTKKEKKHVSVTGRKLYKGSFPANRFGIVPGYRWDGVDRSNGFEAKWFAAQGAKADRARMMYALEIDE